MTYIDYAMSNEDYHDKDKHPHISSSDVKEIAKTSGLHWAIKQNLPRKPPTPAMKFGSAVHAMISEPDKALFARGLPNRLKRKEWAKMEEEAAAKGQTLLTEGEFDEARRISDTALETCDMLRQALSHHAFAYVWPALYLFSSITYGKVGSSQIMSPWSAARYCSMSRLNFAPNSSCSLLAMSRSNDAPLLRPFTISQPSVA